MSVPIAKPVSSRLIPGGPAKEGAPLGSLPEAPKTLTVKTAEIRPTGINTPEKQAETITLSETTYNTFVNTIILHIKAVDKLKSENKETTALDSNFYKLFTDIFKGEDLTKPEILKRCAQEFLRGGKKKELSGSEILADLRLIQLELASLQGALPRTFVPEGKPEYRRELKTGEEEISLVAAEDGTVEISSKPAGSWIDKLFKGKRVKTSTGYKIVGGNKIQIANSLLSSGQQNMLQEMCREFGWPTDGNLDAVQLKAFDTHIATLAAALQEIYLKAGCPLTDFNPNLIKIDPQSGQPSYIDKKTARFIGEKTMTGTENLRDVLTAEGKTIMREIKTRVDKELAEVVAKKQTERAEATVEEQLNAQISKLQESAPSPEKQKVIKTDIEREIKRLSAKVDLFIKQSDLESELPEAEKARDEAKDKVNSRQQTLKVNGETDVNLFDWSDRANPESWMQLQKEYQGYANAKQALINRFNQLNETFGKRFPNGLTEIENVDASGKKQTIKPHPSAISYAAEIDKVHNSIYQESWQQTGKTLEQLITELKEKYERRKTACEENKDVLDPYNQAERTLTGKKEELNSVITKIQTLPVGEKAIDEIDAIIKVKRKELEDVGKLPEITLKEVQALTALKTALPSSGRLAREPRISEAKAGTLLEPEFAVSSEWEKYSPEIRRCVQIIFGDEVLLPYPPEAVKPLVEQVKALLELDKYRNLWTSAIGSKKWEEIDEKVINKIVEDMRIAALGIKKS